MIRYKNIGKIIKMQIIKYKTNTNLYVFEYLHKNAQKFFERDGRPQLKWNQWTYMSSVLSNGIGQIFRND